MSTAAQTTRTATITYEEFAQTWKTEVEAHFADAHMDGVAAGTVDDAQKRREILARLWRDALDLDFDYDELNFADAAQCGFDAWFFDEDDDGEPTLRLARVLARADLPAEGRAVTRVVGEVCASLSAVEGHEDLRELREFWAQSPAGARLALTLLSLNALPSVELAALSDAEAVLSANAPMAATLEAASLYTLYTRDHVDISVRVPLKIRGEAPGDNGFIIGAVGLPDLYQFLKEFREKRGELDALYDKNVRVFLGRKGKTNLGISKTLRVEPENFGLYNNGLTIVARAIEPGEDGAFVLTDPAVVNGCQTTRTLWETLTEQLREPAPTDVERIAAHRDWRARLERGNLAVKVVRVAPAEDDSLDENDTLLGKITRYTNTQNTIQEKDFIALDRDFRRWKRELAGRGVFLEILRNEGTRQRARQSKRGYVGAHYEQIAKAFELLKVYGAGWMNEPGAAWNKNAAFVPPRGAIFRAILRDDNELSGDDFMAALHLQNAAAAQLFGKRGKNVPESRKLTRFLFYRTAVELMRRLLQRFDLPAERGDCSRALLKLANSQSEWRTFVDYATEAIDDYMKPDSDYSIAREPNYSGNFNGFLKREDLAKSRDNYPQLWGEWNMSERLMGRHEAFILRVEKLLR